MLPLTRVGLSIAGLFLIFTAGYLMGRQHGHQATLKAAIFAYQTREAINHEVQNMDAITLCRALSGLSNNECAALMRGDE